MRVSVVEGQAHVRSALCFLIEARPDLTLVGAFGSRPDLSAQLLALRPDVVLLDWELPGHLARQLLAALRRAQEPTRVIVLSARPDAEAQARAAGADAFVSKGQPPALLIQSLYS